MKLNEMGKSANYVWFAADVRRSCGGRCKGLWRACENFVAGAKNPVYSLTHLFL